MKGICELTVAGLKCDAEGCDYRDDSVAGADYDKWLNVPCPKCGAPLLTQADLDTTRAIEEAVALMNEIADDLGITEGEGAAALTSRRKIMMRGDGSVTISAPTIVTDK